MIRDPSRRRALCIGSRGGVGRAVCAVLERRPALFERPPTELFLLDAKSEPEVIQQPQGAQLLPPLKLDGDSLRRLLRELDIQVLIDCSTFETSTAVAAAAATNTDYLSTSVATEALTHVAVDQLFADAPATRSSLLVCSGMNPGIVNALVFAGMEAFAERVGVEPHPEALELQALLVTERDTTERADGACDDPSVFAMTWGPDSALQELCEPKATYWRGGTTLVDHPPWAAFYRARCGHEQIEAMLVPHEEVFTLGARLNIPEVAFLYRIPDDAQRRLLTEPETHADWPLRRLAPPEQTQLRGSDRVGVLLVSARYGELWIGFDTPADAGLPFSTNGTLLQVAAGAVAGWNQLGQVAGLHVPEDLDHRRYLRTVASLLGEPIVVHDPAAPAIPLAERRVDAS